MRAPKVRITRQPATDVPSTNAARLASTTHNGTSNEDSLPAARSANTIAPIVLGGSLTPWLRASAITAGICSRRKASLARGGA